MGAQLTPGFGRFPEGGNGNPFYDSYLGNTKGTEDWYVAVHGIKELDTD